jgi:hypothetical protein
MARPTASSIELPAAVVRNREKRDAGVDRPGPRLVDDHVLAGPGDDGVARPGEGAQGDLIGHGSRRDEQGRLLAGQQRVRLLQEVDGRILAVFVVAHFGLGHGPPHLGSRAGDGVRTQVDQHGATVRYNWRVTLDDAAGPPRAAGTELEVDRVFGTPAPGSDPLLAELANVALIAARAAAAVLAQGATRAPAGVETKTSVTDMVSDVDREAEAAVSRVLSDLRPSDGVLGEEGTSRQGTTDVRWVVDPLDGTTNFLFGIPQFAVSVAAEIGGSPVVGVVIHPSRDETWAAVEGWGARLNGLPCRVADGRSTLATALVATGIRLCGRSAGVASRPWRPS